MNFEDLKFIVMDKLMEKAGALGDDIKLAKSSQEAKRDRPEDSRAAQEDVRLQRNDALHSGVLDMPEDANRSRTLPGLQRFSSCSIELFQFPASVFGSGSEDDAVSLLQIKTMRISSVKGQLVICDLDLWVLLAQLFHYVAQT